MSTEEALTASQNQWVWSLTLRANGVNIGTHEDRRSGGHPHSTREGLFVSRPRARPEEVVPYLGLTGGVEDAGRREGTLAKLSQHHLEKLW